MKILITGASSGIGEELARQYATKENELVLLARREDKLYTIRKELYEKCKSVEVVIADVTDFVSLQEKIRDIGYVDTVILNAGISLGHSSEITPINDFKRLYDVNVLANHAILEVLLPLFEEKRSGKIVFISSLASLISIPSANVYASSKRALNAYAEGIRYEYKHKGITVVNILPGFIKSELTDKNEFKMPFLLETTKGVKRIKKAIDKNREFYAFPRRFYYFIRFINLLPSFMRSIFIK